MASAGITPAQCPGLDSNAYMHVGPHDTGEPAITGLYNGKNAEMIAQIDHEYFQNVYTKGITLKRVGPFKLYMMIELTEMN